MTLISKQLVCQKYIYKIHSSRLRKEKWKLTLPIDEARRNDEIISLADSQILRWIDELNGITNADAQAREIKTQVKRLRKEPNSIQNKRAIKKLYDDLDRLQFKPDYMCLIIDKDKDYYRACRGFSINGVKYKVQSVLAYDVETDIAVLKIDATGLKVLPVCALEHKVGAPVYAIGSSKGLSETFSKGIITYAARELDGVVYVQHDAAISSGNSGGPLINEFGEVIGINTMTMIDSQNLNFAISAKELDSLSYENTYTLAQVYDIERNVLKRLKDYTVKNGEYDTSDSSYSLQMGSGSVSGDDYSTGIFYYTQEDKIAFVIVYESSFILSFDVDEVDGAYTWTYYDDEGYNMSGNVYGSTFNQSKTLSYTYFNAANLVSTSVTSRIRQNATNLLDIILCDFDENYAPVGVTAKDLGFVNY